MLDKNIGVQMNEKEYILRSVLEKAGMENINIQSLVVFTNSLINVENRYPYIKECFLSQLPHIIEEYEAPVQIHFHTMCKLVETILNARSEDQWPVKMDIAEYKTAFAELLVKLEVAEEQKREADRYVEKGGISKRIRDFFKGLFGKADKVSC